MSFEVPDQIDTLHCTGPSLCSQAQRLADDFDACEILNGNRTIRLYDQLNGLAQIGPSLVERITLSVCAGKFLDKRHIAAFWGRPEDGGKLELHLTFRLARHR